MDPNTGFTSQQLLIYGLLVGPVQGLLLGLVPLILGIKRGKRKLGIIGFLVSFVGGAILGPLASIPALLIFTWLIVRKSPTADETGTGPSDAV